MVVPEVPMKFCRVVEPITKRFVVRKLVEVAEVVVPWKAEKVWRVVEPRARIFEVVAFCKVTFCKVVEPVTKRFVKFKVVPKRFVKTPLVAKKLVEVAEVVVEF